TSCQVFRLLAADEKIIAEGPHSGPRSRRFLVQKNVTCGKVNQRLIRLGRMANAIPNLKHATGGEVRWLAGEGRLAGPTCGLAEGHVQANLVVLPKPEAFDFLLFCQRNPKPCPVLDVTEPGLPMPRCAPDADLRTDLPGYCVYQRGELVD